MKIRYLLYTVLVGLFVSFIACSLDENPKSSLTDKEAYRNPNLIYANLVATLYTNIGGSGGGSGIAGADRGLYDLNTFTADEAILPTRGGDWNDGGLWRSLYLQQWEPTNDLITAAWDYLYKVVGLCNMNLDKMQELYDADPENTYLPIYMSEVKALRALFYYYLLDNYARVPIVTSSKIQISDVKQSERSEVYNFVIKELEESLPYLVKANSSKKGSYYGRMTKSVAYMLLAKLALNAQVYSDDKWDLASAPAGTTDFFINGQNVGAWQATIAYCDSIIEENIYKLNDDYSQNFSVANETSPENIFVIPMDPLIYNVRNMYCVRTRHYAHGKAFNNQGGWNGASATLDLLSTFTKGDVKDPRLELCFFIGEVFGPDGNPVKEVPDSEKSPVLVYKPFSIALDLSNTPDEKTAGARWAKYEFDLSALDGGQLVNNDFVIFRYADVLLMKAEALFRAGKTEEADVLLKQVRDRVGAPDRTVSLETILDERMLELSWEGLRRQDLIRFGQYNKAVMDRPETSPARKVFPIPANVLQKNSNLTQNPL